MSNELRSVFIYGRFKGFTRRQVINTLVNRGGRLARSALRADTVVIAHSALARCVVDGSVRLPFMISQDADLMSEGTFLRVLMANPSDFGSGPYAIEDVARLSHVSETACRVLALFDVIGGGDATFSYQDIATSKQVGRLLRDGLDLTAIVSAGIVLGRRGLRLAQTRLATAPWGEIVQSVGDRMVQLTGQFSLVLDEAKSSADQIFARASQQETSGDLEEAERLYSLAERLDKQDPVIPFNRGNTLVELNRAAEAMIAFRQALDRDPRFAEAAFNLAHLYDAERRWDEAALYYRQALGIHPGYAAASYNLARILTDQKLFREAIAPWEAFLFAAPHDPDRDSARRMLALCRMEVKARPG